MCCRVIASGILQKAGRLGPLAGAGDLARALGFEVLPAHVADVRVSGRRIYVSASAGAGERARLIAEGIAHAELDARGDIQTPARRVAIDLLSALVSAGATESPAMFAAARIC